jgi:hypothetical protein
MKTVAMRKAAKAKANGNGKKKKTTNRSEVFQEAYGGGPGKGKKKKSKPYKGPTVVERPGKPTKRFKKGEFENMKGFDKALQDGIIVKTQRGYRYV